jgi:hypothetical protein
MANANLFVAEGKAVFVLAKTNIGDEVEIEAVADPVGAGIECSHGGGRPAGAVAGADADDVEDAGTAAKGQRIDRRGSMADGAGGALRLSLGDDERARLQRRSLGDTGRAGFGFDDRRRIGEAVTFLVEFSGGEDAERHSEMRRRRVERRFIGLDVDGRESSERGGREIVGGQRVRDEVDYFGGRDTALGTDASDKGFRMIEQFAFTGGRSFAYADLDGAAGG